MLKVNTSRQNQPFWRFRNLNISIVIDVNGKIYAPDFFGCGSVDNKKLWFLEVGNWELRIGLY